MKIGHYLKKARETKRFSQSEIAHLLEISQKTLSNIESGKSKPSIEQLSKMEKIYDIDIIQYLNKEGIHFTTSKKFEKAEKEIQILRQTLSKISGTMFIKK
ncbi:helix-turn-helix domain-containing protein [Algoriphagus pacificus]|uniref:Helix-turn-helix transcriptional regulator n=1 Tax=Algoriphagus pacificus TaxID=2811234 RepID=A0ABS3CEW3_9BACT|nr:helix-turn-helix transcriptional regulator [Algoriphagus pacificus]MBN7814696.1 helix-turn-helix transcriptional regulator [Algoriphagus pacificus]